MRQKDGTREYPANWWSCGGVDFEGFRSNIQKFSIGHTCDLQQGSFDIYLQKFERDSQEAKENSIPKSKYLDSTRVPAVKKQIKPFRIISNWRRALSESFDALVPEPRSKPDDTSEHGTTITGEWRQKTSRIM